MKIALVRGASKFQGQKCSATSRAYLARSIWNQIKDDLVATVKSLPVGDTIEHETHVGTVIDEGVLRRPEGVIEKARGLDSHTLLPGGIVRPETGWFADPTLFDTTDPEAFTMSEEFFAPCPASTSTSTSTRMRTAGTASWRWSTRPAPTR